MALQRFLLLGFFCSALLSAHAVMHKAKAHPGHGMSGSHSHADEQSNMEAQQARERRKQEGLEERRKSRQRQFFTPPSRDNSARKNFIYKKPKQTAPKPRRLWNN